MEPPGSARPVFPSRRIAIGPGTALHGYFRPYDINISRAPKDSNSIPVAVKHIQAVGPLICFELIRIESGEIIIAELNKEYCRDLMSLKNETVFIEIRNIKFF